MGGASARDHGVSTATVNEAKRLRELEEENRRLKQMVAEQALDIRALKSVVSRKWRALPHAGPSSITYVTTST